MWQTFCLSTPINHGFLHCALHASAYSWVAVALEHINGTVEDRHAEVTAMHAHVGLCKFLDTQISV
jgi:hypothetical protein